MGVKHITFELWEISSVKIGSKKKYMQLFQCVYSVDSYIYEYAPTHTPSLWEPYRAYVSNRYQVFFQGLSKDIQQYLPLINM